MTPEIRRLLSEVAAGEIGPAVAARAKAILDRESAHRARVRAKARPRLDARSTVKAERAIRMMVIRGALLEETGGRCAACSFSVVLDAADDHRLEAHHLISGGLRRHEERKETMAPLCGSCHRATHRSDPETLRALLDFCVRTGRQMAHRALERRIAKIDEARRTA